MEAACFAIRLPSLLPQPVSCGASLQGAKLGNLPAPLLAAGREAGQLGKAATVFSVARLMSAARSELRQRRGARRLRRMKSSVNGERGAAGLAEGLWAGQADIGSHWLWRAGRISCKAASAAKLFALVAVGAVEGFAMLGWVSRRTQIQSWRLGVKL